MTKTNTLTTISDGQLVSIAYTLKNSQGQVLDSADRNDPLDYIQGDEMIVPGLEKALQGRKVGEKLNVAVSPAEGYGELDEDLLITVERSEFPEDAELEIGAEFEIETDDGEILPFRVEKIEGDEVSINGNHPLAGVTLNFEVEILETRLPTAEELEAAHADCCASGTCEG